MEMWIDFLYVRLKIDLMGINIDAVGLLMIDII